MIDFQAALELLTCSTLTDTCDTIPCPSCTLHIFLLYDQEETSHNHRLFEVNGSVRPAVDQRLYSHWLQ